MDKNISVIITNSIGPLSVRDTMDSLKALENSDIQLIEIRDQNFALIGLNKGQNHAHHNYRLYEELDADFFKPEYVNQIRIVKESFHDLLVTAVNQCRYDDILLIDDSVIMMDMALSQILKEIKFKNEYNAFSLPILENLNRNGAFSVYALMGDPIFYYCVIQKKTISHLLKVGHVRYHYNYLDLAFLMLNSGREISSLEDRKIYVHRHFNPFDQTHILSLEKKVDNNDRLWLQKSGMYEVGISHVKLFGFQNPIKDIQTIIECRKTFNNGCSAIAIQNERQYQKSKCYMTELLRSFKPDFLDMLKSIDIKILFIQLLSQHDMYLDLFQSKIDLLNFLLYFFNDELKTIQLVGDRNFWAHYMSATFYNPLFVNKLINLKI